jgi:uncharacterized protein (TIGR03435 family)
MRRIAIVRLVATAMVTTSSFGMVGAQGRQFEAATVKRNVSGSLSGGVQLQPGGRLTVTNTTPHDMLRFVSGLPDFAVVGGPDWLRSERYDIVAKAEGDLSRDEAAQVLRDLLVERFKLKLRNEARDMAMYALVTLDPNGRLGPRLAPTKTDCAAAERQGAGLCGFDLGGGSITAVGRPMARLIRTLGQLSGRIVVDKTGLVGDYDMTLTWTPDLVTGQAGTSPGDGSSLFTALQEQLGLKLESARGPVDVVVIESAERPAMD